MVKKYKKFRKLRKKIMNKLSTLERVITDICQNLKNK